MMKNMQKISNVFLIAIVFLLLCAGCSKDQDYINGRYRYADNRLEYMGHPESVNGFDVLWSPDITDEQKAIIRNMLTNMVSIPDGRFLMGA